MKLVVLDGYTLNPGDLDWTPLQTLGECVIHDRTLPELVAERAAGAEIILTNKALVPAEVINELPQLKCIVVLATGFNVVDAAAAKARGIPVCNVPGYGTASVAQHVFALLLELCSRTGHHAQTVRDGRWAKSPDWCYWDQPLIELAGRTLGIAGWGAIGQAAGRIGTAFGMPVLAATRTPRPEVECVTVDELFARADVISLHCPLTPETREMVNARRLALMKPGAFLINTGRGPLVDETALAAALNAGQIAGAGLDVLSSEPPAPDNPLLTAKNCLITPHQAWGSREARQRLLTQAIENVRAFQAGSPRHVVNA